MSTARRTAHLARRFVGSLRLAGPSATDEVWAYAHLLQGEAALWAQLSPADRRHAVAVAQEAAERLGAGADRAVVAAALLHDIGKLRAGLGTFARVGATLVGASTGRDRAVGRFGDYLRHDAIGAELLTAAGSDALTIAWAAEHHQPPEAWSLPPDVAAALHAADDD